MHFVLTLEGKNSCCYFMLSNTVTFSSKLLWEVFVVDVDMLLT